MRNISKTTNKIHLRPARSTSGDLLPGHEMVYGTSLPTYVLILPFICYLLPDFFLSNQFKIHPVFAIPSYIISNRSNNSINGSMLSVQILYRWELLELWFWGDQFGFIAAWKIFDIRRKTYMKIIYLIVKNREMRQNKRC